MEVDLFGSVILAFQNIVSLERLGFLSFGVLIGLMLGVIPGLGGLVGLSLLLPFTFSMDPYTALAFMMGLQAVVVTSDTIPAVLFGVPGTVGSAATILDGHPMARKGEAGRAFGAAFSASIIGGLFGALLLGISVPVLRPIVMEIGAPELLAICIFGLSLVAVLSGGSPLKGLAGACIGLMIATVGDDPQTGTLRWTFDSLYLWEGLPVVPLALGLFAIPELADMAITKQSISVKKEDKQDARFGQIEGIKDTLRNWFLVIRCSSIGSSLGAVPGIGASVIDWIAYGHAARSVKGARETFGKGDVRGVIASESSNNAKEGGALIPTIAFGVPGSVSMALILGVFLIHGLVPGPDMMTKNLDVTYTMVWSVAIANIIGAGICFTFANQLAKVALIRIGILVPVVLAITYVGAFQGSGQWGDIYALLIFGLIGWIMKRLRWPRPPLILGFVLGGLVERYMFISIERYGANWISIWRDFGDGDIRFAPYVLIIFAVTLYGVLSPIIRGYISRAKTTKAKSKFGFQKEAINPDFFFAVILFGLFSAAFIVASQWDFDARLIPHVVSIAAMIFIGWLILSALFVAPGEKVETADVHFDISADYGDLSSGEVFKRAVRYFVWLLFFLAAASVVGLLPSMFLFMTGYMIFEGKESIKVTLIVASSIWVVLYLLFHKLLVIPWPQSVLGNWF